MSGDTYDITDAGRAVLADLDAPIEFRLTSSGIRYLRRQRIREAMSMRSNLHAFLPLSQRDFFCMWPSKAFKFSNNRGGKWWASLPYGKCWVKRDISPVTDKKCDTSRQIGGE